MDTVQQDRSLPDFHAVIFLELSAVSSTHGQMINNYWKVFGQQRSGKLGMIRPEFDLGFDTYQFCVLERLV